MNLGIEKRCSTVGGVSPVKELLYHFDNLFLIVAVSSYKAEKK